METKWKDVAHLYLGCEWVWTRYSGEFPTGTYRTDLFNSLLLREMALDNGVAKPILRQLQDITDSDIDLLWVELQLNPDFESPAYPWLKKRNYILEYFSREKALNHERFDFKQTVILSNWLRKNGYDCDNLIPTSQAIDAKQVK